MIKFGEQLDKMILHEGITTIRIKNFGKRVADCTASTPEELIKELQTLAPSISSYGKLIFLAGKDTEATQKSNYANALEWLISFSSDVVYGQPQQTNTNMTFNKQYADLLQENMMLKMVAPLQLQIKELQEKKGEGIGEYLQYFPLVSPMLGIKDEDMFKRMQLMMMMKDPALMKGMLAGTPQGATGGAASTEPADKQIQNHLESISKKVSAEKMLKLVSVLDNNPGLADTLVAMIPGTASKGMAGTEEKAEEMKEEFKATKSNPAPGLYLAGTEDEMI